MPVLTFICKTHNAPLCLSPESFSFTCPYTKRTVLSSDLLSAILKATLSLYSKHFHSSPSSADPYTSLSALFPNTLANNQLTDYSVVEDRDILTLIICTKKTCFPKVSIILNDLPKSVKIITFEPKASATLSFVSEIKFTNLSKYIEKIEDEIRELARMFLANFFVDPKKNRLVRGTVPESTFANLVAYVLSYTLRHRMPIAKIAESILINGKKHSYHKITRPLSNTIHTRPEIASLLTNDLTRISLSAHQKLSSL